MRLTQAGVDLIKEFEGCRLEAYPDPGTGSVPWTIGYGHTGPDVTKGMSITQERAEELLRKDLMKFELGVIELVPGVTSDNQFSACVSLAYNIGIENFKRSLLLRCMQKYNFDHAAGEFLKWNHAGGRVLKGLTRRREAEMKLFLT